MKGTLRGKRFIHKDGKEYLFLFDNEIDYGRKMIHYVHLESGWIHHDIYTEEEYLKTFGYRGYGYFTIEEEE